VHLGNCDIGCDVRARNTLDLNYLARAETKSADVRPLHVVTTVAPDGTGYRVSFNRIEAGKLVPGSATAGKVIVAAGSIGSTELLLRCRDEHRTLPNISAQLGVNWSSNGDFLTPAIHPLRRVDPTHGPTITSAINMLDGSAYGQDVFIEDGGLPDILRGGLARWAANPPADPIARLVIESLRPLLAGNALADHVMPWFAQSRDAGDGRLHLDQGRLTLDWNIAKSKPTIDAVVRLHQELALATEGMALTPLTWTVGNNLITPHPLGGCNLGRSAADRWLAADLASVGVRSTMDLSGYAASGLGPIVGAVSLAVS